MRFLRTLILLLLAGATFLGIAGCADPYGASAKAASTIAASVGTGYKTIQALQQTGTISSQEALNVAGYLKFASDGDKAFESCIQSAHSSPVANAFTACAQTFVTTLNTPTELALIHVKDSGASATISNIVSGITAGLAILETALGGA